MNTKNLITIVTLLYSIFGFSQIEIGKIEKKKEVENIVKFPQYNNSENFIEHTVYYRDKTIRLQASGKNPYEEKQCDVNEYYKRYNGLKIYYPTYPNDYRKNDILFFKKTDKIEILNWSQTSNKYFTIISIDPLFQKSELYNEVKSNFSRDFFGDILFELKDNLSNETIYVIESSSKPKFILVPYFEKTKEYLKSNKFIATKDFSGVKVPLTTTDYSLNVSKNSEWNVDFRILRSKDLRLDASQKLQSDEDVEYMLLLSQFQKNDTIIMDLNKFENLFIAKKDFNKQTSQNKNDEKLKESNFIKKYGEKFGKLVYQKKITIGMSKDMCSDIYGITLNRKKVKNANGEIEVWEYTGMAKLYFKNGKLNEIRNY